MTPDGVVTFHYERGKIEEELRRQATRCGWPQSELGDLLGARADGLACFWARLGKPEVVVVSPDTGPHRGRAQRIEFKARGGIKQWAWLPLHRVRNYEFELLARSPDLASVKVSLTCQGTPSACAEATVNGLTGDWHKLAGTLTVPQDSPADVPYCLELSCEATGAVSNDSLTLQLPPYSVVQVRWPAREK